MIVQDLVNHPRDSLAADDDDGNSETVKLKHSLLPFFLSYDAVYQNCSTEPARLL